MPVKVPRNSLYQVTFLSWKSIVLYLFSTHIFSEHIKCNKYFYIFNILFIYFFDRNHLYAIKFDLISDNA